ncbi:hypothetical protein JCM11641_001912 [Rhodosporidiobolus odoratus]
MPAPPARFPSNVNYLSTPSPSPKLPKHHRDTFCSPCPPQHYPNPPPKLAIKVITDPTHPAYGQSGLFNATGKPIERGTWLRDYLGVVHTEEEMDPKSDYDLSLLREVRVEEDGKEKIQVVGCDATKAGNEARFVNDYRGTTLPRPSAIFELRCFPLPAPAHQPAKEGIRMAVFAGPHGIEKNAEICVSYGRGFWEKRREEAEREQEETMRAAEGKERTKAAAEQGKGVKGKKKDKKG